MAEDVFELRAPAVVFPTSDVEVSAYRVAFDLLTRRHPGEALRVLEPALDADPTNTGLRVLRAWGYLIRVQVTKAEQELRLLVEDNPGDDWVRFALAAASNARRATSMRCRTYDLRRR